MQASTPDEPVPAGRGAHHRSRNALAVAVTVTLLGAVVAAVSLWPLFFAAPLAPSEPEVAPSTGALVVAVARTAGGPSEWTNWARVFKYLSEELGRPVTLRYLTEEEELGPVLASERIDLAVVCPHQYVDLSEQGKIIGLCSPVINGSHLTSSMLVVAEDSKYTSLADLKGSHAAVSDKTSLGGYAYLLWLCRTQGLDPVAHFREMTLGETQEANVQAVLAGRADCTVVNASQAAPLLKGLRVIATSTRFGTPPVVATAGVETATVDAARAALVRFDSAERLAGFDSSIGGFVPLDPADYRFVLTLRRECGHHDHGSP